MRNSAVFVLHAAFWASVGCGQPAGISEQVLRDRLAASLHAADEVLLFEGLPHQAFEADLLKSELARSETVRYGGFPFYATPLQPAAEDLAALQGVLADEKSLAVRDPNLAKSCGGFHPDFALVWKAGADEYQALICLGCSEVKFLGKSVDLHRDLRKPAYERLKERLQPYRVNRPASEPSR